MMLELPHFPPLIDPENACLHDPRLLVDSAQQTLSPTAHHVKASTTALMETPNPSTTRSTTLLYGEQFTVLHKEKEWAYGYANIDGYVGWVMLHDITKTENIANTQVATPLTYIYQKADMKSLPLQPIPFGGLLELDTSKEENGFVRVISGGWVFAKHIKPLPAKPVSLWETATAFLNVPYLWGGRSIWGMDCSALVQLAAGASGLRIHRDSDLQFKSLGIAIAEANVEQGDLVFFPGHVGIMADKNNVLHANATRMKVSLDPLKEVLSWVAMDLEKKAISKPALSGFKRLL